MASGAAPTAGEPKRARDIGIPFEGTPGKNNAITDVAGVEVGHHTIIEGSGNLIKGKGPIRTGVTAILPGGKSFTPLFANWHALNGNGDMTGTHWLTEAGILETPILITNTNSMGTVRDAMLEWMDTNHYYQNSDKGVWFGALPVAAETWDGVLNDINGFHVKKKHAWMALDAAKQGPVAEGCVGGGTGMVCHEFKGGIGTSSRVISDSCGGYTVGVLVQANYGLRHLLTIAGAPIGKELSSILLPVINSFGEETTSKTPFTKPKDEEHGSIIVVVATDAPLLPHQLKRIAKRVTLGIGKVGGIGGNSSGDVFIAFSTANKNCLDENNEQSVIMYPNDKMNALFEATVQATEEAIVNAMVAAKTMKGINDNTVFALPHGEVVELLKKYNRIQLSFS